MLVKEPKLVTFTSYKYCSPGVESNNAFLDLLALLVADLEALLAPLNPLTVELL